MRLLGSLPRGALHLETDQGIAGLFHSFSLHQEGTGLSQKVLICSCWREAEVERASVSSGLQSYIYAALMVSWYPSMFSLVSRVGLGAGGAGATYSLCILLQWLLR